METLPTFCLGVNGKFGLATVGRAHGAGLCASAQQALALSLAWAERQRPNSVRMKAQAHIKKVHAAGLAIAIVGGGEGVPAFLRTKRVLSLDMGLLIAGAKERGELELRVTRLLQETRDAGDVILMCGSPEGPGFTL